MSKRIEIKETVTIEVEASALVSGDENACALRVTTRVLVGNVWKDVDITSALSDRDKAEILVAIEDQYRDDQRAKADFGTDEAG